MAMLTAILPIALGACAGNPPSGGNGVSSAAPVSVVNRVKIGDENWLFLPGGDGSSVEAGTIESFEVVNDTGSDIVPDVGLNKTAFKIEINGCRTILKPGQTCTVRGEWLAEGARQTTLDVAVTKQNVPNATTKRISVPLAASSSADAPVQAISPTPVTISTGTPSPPETSTTATSTPSTSMTDTPTSSGTPGQTPSATLSGSQRR